MSVTAGNGIDLYYPLLSAEQLSGSPLHTVKASYLIFIDIEVASDYYGLQIMSYFAFQHLANTCRTFITAQAHQGLKYALGITMLVFTGFSYAATLTVNTPFPSGAGSLEDTISNASAGDTIVFSESLNGLEIIISNEIIVNQNLTINGNDEITLRAVNDSRHFSITGGTITLNNLTLTNGFADEARGGSINVAETASLIVNRCRFLGNEAGTNNASETDGNTQMFGGAIHNDGNTNINNSLLLNNSAFGGGAISNTGTLIISNSSVFSNEANFDEDFESGIGGALLNDINGTATISNSTIAINNASNGGAIMHRANGMLSVQKNTFTNNTASGLVSTGGAIDSRGPLLASNNTFSNNRSNNGDGGAIFYTGGDTESLYLAYNTLVDNTATNGVSLSLDSSNRPNLTVANNIFVGTSGSSTHCDLISTDTEVVMANNIADDDSCNTGDLAGMTYTREEIGISNSAEASLFILLGLSSIGNSCITPHMTPFGLMCGFGLKISEDSVAVNAADSSLALSPLLDQRGLARSLGGPSSDVGAFEVLPNNCNNNTFDVSSVFELDNALMCYNGSEAPLTTINITQNFDVAGIPTSIFNETAGDSIADLNTTPQQNANGEISLPERSKALNINGNGFTLDALEAGLHFIASGDVTIDNIILENGTSIAGGSVIVFSQGERGDEHDVTISNSTLRNNTVTPIPFNLLIPFSVTEIDQNTNRLFGASVSASLPQASEISEFGPLGLQGGGAILVANSSLRIDNSVISNNSALFGGGVFALNGDVLIENSLFHSNNAEMNIQESIDEIPFFPGIQAGGEGGAIANFEGFIEINNSSFINNRALLSNGRTGGNGGAILNAGFMEISASTFSGNTAISESTQNDFFRLPGLSGLITSNIGIPIAPSEPPVLGGNGGAILNSGFMFIFNSTLSNNAVSYDQHDFVDGGPPPYSPFNVAAFGLSEPIPDLPTQSPAGTGGAITNIGRLQSSNNTITNNSAQIRFVEILGDRNEASSAISLLRPLGRSIQPTQPGIGGGVFNNTNGLLMNTIRSAYFADRQFTPSVRANGLFGGPMGTSSAVIVDSLLSNNGLAGNCGGPIEFEGTNFTDEIDSCLTPFFSEELSSSNIVLSNSLIESDNINLGTLADNGCVTMQAGIDAPVCGFTHALLEGSVAIDASDFSFFDILSTTSNQFRPLGLISRPGSETTDQRGIIRPQGRRFDVGSYELNDSDFDGIINDDDNCIFIPNLNQADFELDGLGDVCDNDIDGDGLSNNYELANGLDPFNSFDRDADPDRDGFSNIDEFRFGTDPNVADTDVNNNGIPDLAEREMIIAPVLELLLFSEGAISPPP